MTALPYESLRNQLKTGDIILYSGKTPFSMAIRLATRCPWSHCGMVLKLEQYDFLTVWESTLLTHIKDVETQQYMKGVQLMPLSERVRLYDGEIAVRQLQDVVFSEADTLRLMKLRKEISRRPYDFDILEMFRSAYDGIGGDNQEDLSSIFCSELVAEAYQRLGLLDGELASNEYTPADFADDRKLKLLRGSLSQAIKIHR